MVRGGELRFVAMATGQRPIPLETAARANQRTNKKPNKPNNVLVTQRDLGLALPASCAMLVLVKEVEHELAPFVGLLEW